MLFGKNQQSEVILACLGLTEGDCGRFRDCYVDDDQIVIHTRNGGGNRECWHSESPECGSEGCKHHTREVEVNERVEATEEEIKVNGWKACNVFIGSKRLAETGKRVMETEYICEQPDSEHCACPGCVINYRLPKHPCYLYDEDDDYDCTYADIFFKFPEEYAEELKAIAANSTDIKPGEKWKVMFKAWEGKKAQAL